jgi:antirestriction protein ArdC
MTRRIALITTLLVLALAAPAAAQSGGAFGPLPPAEATPTATPTTTSSGSTDTGRNVLFIIGGALIIGFAVMGWMILRDARTASAKVGDGIDHDRVRSETLHKRQQANKAKQRQKTRAQKRARKVQRNR